ncbi:MAG: hypothetical protein NC084_08885 [Bacteroides sp.]|nr:N4-gp56 family major capsid protein [Eubacterium sp.]MCM1418743.1 N4-gp56 family major capsid protein [Roseburia sp.]MCM1462811.1 hypothetical protein [Bacteroides sp.]
MAINLAEKYSNQIDETIRSGLLSSAGVNNDVSFGNAQTVTVFSMETAPLGDYNPDGGMQRYGEPVELQDATQEMKMTQQKAFTFTIDKTYAADSPEGVRNAGRALQRQIEQVIVPEIDRYRFAKLAELAGNKDYGALTAENAYTAFVEANSRITDEEFPVENRVAFCSNGFIDLLKQDSVHFTKATELAQRRVVYKGMIGDCDGVAIIAVPKRRLPAGVSFIITHPSCAPAPVKLQEYKIHRDPPGIAGHLIEGLLYHDIFVFDRKKAAIAVRYGALGKLEAKVTDGVLAVSGDTNGGTLVYKATSAAPALGDALGADWIAVPADGKLAASGKLYIAVKNAEGKCTAVSGSVSV